MAEGGGTLASIPDYILDEVPPLHEIVEHARTDCCMELATMLELDSEDLSNVKTESSLSKKISAVYQLWLDKKGKDATRRRLLAALRTKHVGQNRVAESYEEVLIKKATEKKNIENKAPNIMEKYSSNFKKGHHRNREKELKERALNYRFRMLLSAVCVSSDMHIDIKQLKLHIKLWLVVDQVESYSSAQNHFVSYRNPQLLEEIVEEFLLRDDNVVTRMDQYTRDLEAFKLTLKELEQVSCEEDLGPRAPSGLPEFTLKADNHDMTKQQFQTTLSESIPQSNHTLLKSINPGSIIMTFVVLPCATSAVMKELTNPIVLKKLKSKGVRVIKPHPQRTICAKTLQVEFMSSISHTRDKYCESSFTRTYFTQFAQDSV